MKPGGIPSLSRVPVVGNLYSLLRLGIVGFLTASTERPHKLQRLNLLGKSFVLINDPALAQEVLVNLSGKLAQGPILNHFAKKFLGEGLLTAENELHNKRKKKMIPVFRPAHVRLFRGVIDDLVVAEFAKLRAGEIEFNTLLETLNQELVSKVLFGQGQSTGELARDIGYMNKFVLGETLQPAPLPPWVWTPGRARARKILGKIDHTISTIISSRQAHLASSQEERKLMIDHLLEVFRNDDQTLDAVAIRNEAMGIYVAGHETSASALTWIFYTLLKHPAIRDRVTAEARASTEQYETQMPYTTNLIKEVLRVYPPVYLLSRTVLEDLSLDGRQIRKGEFLMINLIGIHRSEKVHLGASELRPERHDDPSDPVNSLPGSYIPFSAGTRSCIGASFALVQMLSVVRHFCQRFDFATDHLPEERYEALVTMKPKFRVRAKIYPVSPPGTL